MGLRRSWGTAPASAIGCATRDAAQTAVTDISGFMTRQAAVAWGAGYSSAFAIKARAINDSPMNRLGRTTGGKWRERQCSGG